MNKLSKLSRCVAIGGIVLALGVVSARAATFYVATNSPADGPGTGWTNAFHTIQDAVNAANANDTVLVTNGVYATGGAPNGSPAMSNRVVIAKAITVQSVNGSSVTLIQGAPDPVTGGLGTNATRCVYMSAGLLTGFTLTNGYTRTDGSWNTQQGGGGALVTGGVISNCVVTACTAAHFGGGLDLFGGDAMNCSIFKNTAYAGGGMKLEGSSAYNCLLHDNRATDSGGGAFFYQGGTLGSSTVVNNSATNGGGGVYCYLGGNSYNNIIYFNTNNGSANNWATNGGSTFRSNCTTPADPDDNRVVTDDPRLINPAAGDYRLQPGSPCVDTGLDDYLSGASDLAGNPRIIAYLDIGAYEYTPPAVTITNSVTTVPVDQGTIVLGGTSAYLTGLMSYANAANGASGSLPAQPVWTTPAIALIYGPNQISVTGTNYAGASASANITITRQRPSVVYVAPGGSNLPPYTNWANAATTIQAAVDMVALDGTVWVSNGVYAAGGKVTPGGAESNRVCITANITVQSVNGPSNTSIVGIGPMGTKAMRCAFLTAGTLSGFTLTNGFTRSSVFWDYDEEGGGACLNGGGTVSNCVVTGCTSYDAGGGICCINAGTVNNCTIIRNTSRSSDYGGSGVSGGGGVALVNGGAANNCVISGNTAYKSSQGGGMGGGISCDYGGTVNNCIISNNAASWNGGGGVYFVQGGSINNCTVCGNTSAAGGSGGGIQCEQGGQTLQNCLVYGNTADDGAGIYFFNSATMRNCTVTGNTNGTPDNGVGLYLKSGGTVQNCIIFGNQGGGANIYNPSGGVISNTCSPSLAGSGNITNDPVFVNSAAKNFRLADASPCINAGNNASAAGSTDLDGRPRVVGGTVDMGAYEFQGSGKSAFIGWLALHALPTDGSADTTDPDGDGCNNWQEYSADTDPTNAVSYFHIQSVTNLPPLTVTFLASSNRVYSLNCTTNLSGAPWAVVPGQSNVAGTGGVMSLTDTNHLPQQFYRLNVALP